MRIVVEVIALSIAAELLSLLVFFLLCLLGTFGTIVATLVPFAAGFYYGYRRKLQLHLVAVWIGWIIGGYVFGCLVWAVIILTHGHIPPHGKLTSSLLANWAIWIGLTFVEPLLPAFMVMWGQRVRLRAGQRNK